MGSTKNEVKKEKGENKIKEGEEKIFLCK